MIRKWQEFQLFNSLRQNPRWQRILHFLMQWYGYFFYAVVLCIVVAYIVLAVLLAWAHMAFWFLIAASFNCPATDAVSRVFRSIGSLCLGLAALPVKMFLGNFLDMPLEEPISRLPLYLLRSLVTLRPPCPFMAWMGPVGLGITGMLTLMSLYAPPR